MENTWLVQRLLKPPKSDSEALPAQVFGGIATATKEQWKVMQQYFNLDYMGSAEFEFGTVPRVIHEMAKVPLTAFRFQLPGAAVEEPFWRRFGKPRKKAPPRPKQVEVYVLCKKEHAGEVAMRIRDIAGGKIRLKESTCFGDAFDPEPSDLRRAYREIVGWLELDNGFFFFLDKSMWQGVRRLFGVEKEEGNAVPAVEAPVLGDDVRGKDVAGGKRVRRGRSSSA